MKESSAGFAAIYRWRLRPGMEDQFIKAWTRISELYLHQGGSLGSRLHRGHDGLWYSYAQWPDEATRKNAFSAGALDKEAGELMRDSIAESLPEITLEPMVDLLVLPHRTKAES
ncbi:antibiotic biosynthesis monooxygenase family protein [Dyella telluris]|uniref:Antibiotic biosynthesis monooxygenase n=1 Tax=Dyella telluris TaxID=2763498 RepID=A0A7G8Q7N8_9GAMM|nr:antibiotic biosynthesis monooxygenase [Dyella telluris]QNK02796.1 antibiotic biosynthesis monooxygenase [Dyella telluris]